MKQRQPLDDPYDAAEAPGIDGGRSGKCIQRWVQGEHGCGKGVCATVVLRWLKYKLIGSDRFWDVLENDGGGWRREKWASIQDKHSHYVSETKGRMVAKDVHWGGQYVVERLTGHRDKTFLASTKARKMRELFAGLAYQFDKNLDLELVDEIMGTVMEFSDCASYVSLSSHYFEKLDSHAVGVFCTGNSEVYFFDPNMGEVWFPDRMAFRNWWVNEYRVALRKEKTFAGFNTCRITRMHGLSELERIKELKSWMLKEMAPRHKLTDSLDFTMGGIGIGAGSQDEVDWDAELAFELELGENMKKFDPALMEEMGDK